MAQDQMIKSEGRELEGRNYRVWPFCVEGKTDDDQIAFPVDISETEDAFLLVGDLPGVRKEDLEVRLAENELTIKGTIKRELDHQETPWIREVPGAGYLRSFTLSDAVDPGKISAEMKDGVLRVHLAKAEHVKPRVIQITG